MEPSEIVHKVALRVHQCRCARSIRAVTHARTHYLVNLSTTRSMQATKKAPASPPGKTVVDRIVHS